MTDKLEEISDGIVQMRKPCKKCGGAGSHFAVLCGACFGTGFKLSAKEYKDAIRNIREARSGIRVSYPNESLAAQQEGDK